MRGPRVIAIASVEPVPLPRNDGARCFLAGFLGTTGNGSLRSWTRRSKGIIVAGLRAKRVNGEKGQKDSFVPRGSPCPRGSKNGSRFTVENLCLSVCICG